MDEAHESESAETTILESEEAVESIPGFLLIQGSQLMKLFERCFEKQILAKITFLKLKIFLTIFFQKKVWRCVLGVSICKNIFVLFLFTKKRMTKNIFIHN